MDSRPEAEADSNKISTRTHNPGLDLAPQWRESAVHAGAGSLWGAPSAWSVRVDSVQTYSTTTVSVKINCEMPTRTKTSLLLFGYEHELRLTALPTFEDVVKSYILLQHNAKLERGDHQPLIAEMLIAE